MTFPQPYKPKDMKNKKYIRSLSLCILLLGSSVPATWAASITNNGTGGALTAGGSWIGGVAPGSADVAFFDTNVTANGTSALGGNTTWGGIKILNPAVP